MLRITVNNVPIPEPERGLSILVETDPEGSTMGPVRIVVENGRLLVLADPNEENGAAVLASSGKDNPALPFLELRGIR